jgi:outer membrane biosynthesis protein TonB
VPDRRSIFRLLALAGFLLTVALALWLAEVRPLFVIIVMAAALAVAWAVEWLSWRQEVPRLVAEGSAVDEVSEGVEAAVHPPEPAEPAPLPLAPPAPPVLPAEPLLEPAAPATPRPEPEAPAPAPPAEPEPPPVVPRPEPPQPRPPLRPVPTPPPEPPTPPEWAPAAGAEPVPAAAHSEVVDLRTRATGTPRRWNLWDLERRARDEQQRSPDRYEEWSYLFVHLRQFATPDGSLPTEFDGLVRESFGDLLEHAG